MAVGGARWQSILREERSKVPSGSGFHAYAAATKRASARYRGHSSGERANPRIGLGTVALVGGAAYLLLTNSGKAMLNKIGITLGGSKSGG